MSTTKTSIEWTDHSVNPFRARNKETGKCGHFCVKISPGCKFCYSSRLQPRFGLFPFVAENRSKVDLFLDESKLRAVLTRRKPTKFFWCDMTDMFWEDYPDEWIDRCFATMALTPQHTHQVLTKRAERMSKYLSSQLGAGHRGDVINGQIERLWKTQNHFPRGRSFPRYCESWPLSNVWLGVSAEDQQRADERVPWLLKTPAAVRFVSHEPALGPVDFEPYLCICKRCGTSRGERSKRCGSGLHWLIVGGESGPGARPFNVHWARDVIQQCKAAGVACFVKQFGAKPYEIVGHGFHYAAPRHPNPVQYMKLKDKKGGNMAEWPADLRVREFPAVATMEVSR